MPRVDLAGNRNLWVCSCIFKNTRIHTCTNIIVGPRRIHIFLVLLLSYSQHRHQSTRVSFRRSISRPHPLGNTYFDDIEGTSLYLIKSD